MATPLPLDRSLPDETETPDDWVDRPLQTDMKNGLSGKIDAVEDRDWITASFTQTINNIPRVVRDLQISNSADAKFTDASLGGNYSLNAEPQFTPYSDPRRSIITAPNEQLDYDPSTGLLAGNSSVARVISPAAYNYSYPAYTGMGGIYSEQHDDVKQTVSLTPGVPKFNSALAFWTSFLNPDVEIAARTGVIPGALTKTIATGISAILLTTRISPYMITAWIVHWVTRLMIGNANGRYYRLDPTPHLYLNSLNTAINHLTARMGMYPDLEREQNSKKNTTLEQRINSTALTVKEIAALKTLAPSIFTDNYGIDMFAIMGRTESIRRSVNTILADRAAAGTDARKDTANIIRNLIKINASSGISPVKETKHKTLYDVVKSESAKWIREDYVKGELDKKAKSKLTGDKTDSKPEEPAPEEGGGDANEVNAKDIIDKLSRKPDNYSDDPLYENKDVKFNDTDEGIETVLRESAMDSFSSWVSLFADTGTLFSTFDVDYTGPVTETWTTDASDIESGSAFNSTSAGIQSTRYNLAGGNILGGTIGEGIQTLLSGAATVVMGVAHSATGGLSSAISALFRGADIDMPKRPGNSSVELAGSSYSFTINCHSGSKYTQLTQAWIPVLALMVMASPRKVGPASHIAPYLVALHDRGRRSISTGLISRLTITRGEGNVGFTKDKETLSFKVEFDVLDLAPIMSIPVSTGSLYNTMTTLHIELGDEFSEYLDAVTARTMAEKTFLSSRISLSRVIASRNRGSVTSTANFAHSLMDSGPGRLYTNLFGDEYAKKRN